MGPGTPLAPPGPSRCSPGLHSGVPGESLRAEMKPIWRGNLIFELLTIPIRLYAATGSRRVELRLLHANDHSPIRLERICVEEGRPVPPEASVRARKSTRLNSS